MTWESKTWEPKTWRDWLWGYLFAVLAMSVLAVAAVVGAVLLIVVMPTVTVAWAAAKTALAPLLVILLWPLAVIGEMIGALNALPPTAWGVIFTGLVLWLRFRDTEKRLGDIETKLVTRLKELEKHLDQR